MDEANRRHIADWVDNVIPPSSTGDGTTQGTSTGKDWSEWARKVWKSTPPCPYCDPPPVPRCPCCGRPIQRPWYYPNHFYFDWTYRPFEPKVICCNGGNL